MKSWYEILEVPRSASAAEIRSAYLKMAREYHPDRVPEHLTKLRAIHSTEDLAVAVAQRGPGSRVNEAYSFRTNLGRMSKQTSLILARGDWEQSPLVVAKGLCPPLTEVAILTNDQQPTTHVRFQGTNFQSSASNLICHIA